MSDYIEKRMMLVIYTLGVGFFIIRVLAMYDGTWDEMSSDPKWVDSMDKIQFIVELLITGSFIMCVIPRWIDKMQNTKLKTALCYGCSIIGCVLIVAFIPEITDKPIEEQKIIYAAVLVVVMVVFYAIAYWYGKKYKTKKDDEEGVENNENDD